MIDTTTTAATEFERTFEAVTWDDPTTAESVHIRVLAGAEFGPIVGLIITTASGELVQVGLDATTAYVLAGAIHAGADAVCAQLPDEE